MVQSVTVTAKSCDGGTAEESRIFFQHARPRRRYEEMARVIRRVVQWIAIAIAVVFIALAIAWAVWFLL